MKKAFIFDLDGTIVDSVGAIADCANFCMGEKGLSPQPINAYMQFAGDGQYELIKRALKASGDIELKYYDEVMARYVELFKDCCHIGCTAYDGVRETLEILKAKGIKLAVLSNKAHFNTIKVVEYVYGQGYFDYIQGQMDHINKKPSPDGVYMVMEELGVTSDECIYVGDTSVDMLTGHAAEIFAVGVTWGFRDRAELIEYKADAIIDKPEELLEYL